MIKKLIAFLLFLTFILMADSGFAAIFNGFVLDASTGKPLEGVVVVAKWEEVTATPMGPSSRIKDVKETLTNREGYWEIKGPKGKYFSHENDSRALFMFFTLSFLTQPPSFIVYKPGYCPYPNGYFIDACKGMYVNDAQIGNIGHGETLGIPKLTEREDRRKAFGVGPIHGGDTKKKREKLLSRQKHFIRLLEEEKQFLWPE